MTFDFNNDGRLDVLVTRNIGPVNLYRNNWQETGNWIGFELQGRDGNRDAIGALVTVEAGGKSMISQKKAGSSYQTSSDPRLHFGLGAAGEASLVTVRWPGGGSESFELLQGGRYYRIEQGAGSPIALPKG